MKNVNNSFNNYRKTSSTPSSNTDIEATLNIYIHDRKTFHHNVLKNETECWQDEIKKTNNKDLGENRLKAITHPENQLNIHLLKNSNRISQIFMNVMMTKKSKIYLNYNPMYTSIGSAN